MLMMEARNQIVDFGKQLSTSGLTKGTSGNLSVYDAETGYMAISPSGIGYFETQPADIVIMTLDGKIIEGNRSPSSEYDLHATIYKIKPDMKAVVHTHSTYCTTYACLRKPVEAVHYVIASVGGGTIPCAEYATFGTEALAQSVRKSIGTNKAVLLANHGLVTCGISMAKAFSLAVSCEFCAEMQWRTESVGKPAILSKADIDDVLERFKTYGQAKKPDKNNGGY